MSEKWWMLPDLLEGSAALLGGVLRLSSRKTMSIVECAILSNNYVNYS